MKELVEVIARALVENPDEVVVIETEKDGETLIELKVAPSDMGKVIGKQGRIAKAIRSVVKAAASKEDKKVVFKMMDFYGRLAAGRCYFLDPWSAWGSEGISHHR